MNKISKLTDSILKQASRSDNFNTETLVKNVKLMNSLHPQMLKRIFERSGYKDMQPVDLKFLNFFFGNGTLTAAYEALYKNDAELEKGDYYVTDVYIIFDGTNLTADVGGMGASRYTDNPRLQVQLISTTRISKILDSIVQDYLID